MSCGLCGLVPPTKWCRTCNESYCDDCDEEQHEGTLQSHVRVRVSSSHPSGQRSGMNGNSIPSNNSNPDPPIPHISLTSGTEALSRRPRRSDDLLSVPPPSSTSTSSSTGNDNQQSAEPPVFHRRRSQRRGSIPFISPTAASTATSTGNSASTSPSIQPNSLLDRSSSPSNYNLSPSSRNNSSNSNNTNNHSKRPHDIDLSHMHAAASEAAAAAAKRSGSTDPSSGNEPLSTTTSHPPPVLSLPIAAGQAGGFASLRSPSGGLHSLRQAAGLLQHTRKLAKPSDSQIRHHNGSNTIPSHDDANDEGSSPSTSVVPSPKLHGSSTDNASTTTTTTTTTTDKLKVSVSSTGSGNEEPGRLTVPHSEVREKRRTGRAKDLVNSSTSSSSLSAVSGSSDNSHSTGSHGQGSTDTPVPKRQPRPSERDRDKDKDKERDKPGEHRRTASSRYGAEAERLQRLASQLMNEEPMRRGSVVHPSTSSTSAAAAAAMVGLARVGAATLHTPLVQGTAAAVNFGLERLQFADASTLEAAAHAVAKDIALLTYVLFCTRTTFATMSISLYTCLLSSQKRFLTSCFYSHFALHFLFI